MKDKQANHPSFSPLAPDKHRTSLIGLAVGVSVIALWGMSLSVLCSLPLVSLNFSSIVWIVGGIAVQTFLYTGLFITAHDAMHNTVFPNWRPLNNAIGQLALTLYAMFSFSKLLSEHRLHHQYPGTERDPDFYRTPHKGLWRWYIGFVVHYLTWQQLVLMAIVFNILHHLLEVPLANLLLFWVLPALLSTFQLFYFGTYLPHNDEPADFGDHHRSRSNNFPVWLSFLTCYHFGYHHEHHLAPHVPWWLLPAQRRLRQ